jgi:16S rRNA (guanine527-N7)-methyltransferase
MDQNRQQIMPEKIFYYFPSLSKIQKERFIKLESIYRKWNDMINVISRKDMDNFILHHVIHSLSIAKAFEFLPGTTILDVGTGGGFPGIPLAIMFPCADFTLLDSTGKKIKVVAAAAEELGLENVKAVHKRAQEEEGRYHYVISRAVTEFRKFVSITSKNIESKVGNGIIYLKGGDLSSELAHFQGRVKIWNISDFFEEPFFETKKIVYLPVDFSKKLILFNHGLPG